MSDQARADETLKRVSEALKSRQAAAFPEIIKLVHTLSQKNDEITVQELAELVKKDSTVLVKVLQVANSLGYNPSNVRVSTVPQAIQVIGFNRVRTLAMSLLLLEQSNRFRSPEEQRESATLALCSGLFAQAAAVEQAFVDPEQAFVCASLRHFGRIVMTTFLTDEYRTAHNLAATLGEDEAFRSTLGITPLELGCELLRAEELPGEILGAIKRCSPEAIAAAGNPPEMRLLALCGFSAQLCELACTPGLNAAAFAAQSNLLAADFAKVLPGIGAQMQDLLQSASEQLTRLKHGLGIHSLPMSMLDRVKHRVAKKDPPGSNTPMPSPAPSPAAPAPTVTTNVAAGLGLETGVAELTALANDTGASSDALCLAVLEIMHRTFAAPECILFLLQPAQGVLRITHGFGHAWRELQPHATIRPGERTLFGLCLQRRDNLLIHDVRDAALAVHCPAWLKHAEGLSAFALMPILHGPAVLGLVLVGWPERRKITLTPDQVRHVREILAFIAGTLSA